jgi:hypothetical protein
MTHQRQKRFINNNLPNRQEANHNSLRDYEDLPLLTLEEAVEKIIPLIPNVMDYVATAKKKYNWHSTLLTRDESAAIYLYTIPKTEFFFSLNIALRDPNRQVLNPWLNFLKLLITALKKLPSTEATIWRGVDYDATSDFIDGEVYTYWYISSCSRNLGIAELLLHKNGTLFNIDAIHGKDISMFSAVPDEQEVILMPGTRVRAISRTSNLLESFYVIQLEEINFQR